LEKISSASAKGVIPNARAFTSARRDLAWSCCVSGTREILHSAWKSGSVQDDAKKLNRRDTEPQRRRKRKEEEERRRGKKKRKEEKGFLRASVPPW